MDIETRRVKQREWSKRWREKNPDKVRCFARAYRQKNKTQQAEKDRARRLANLPLYLQREAESRERNREQLNHRRAAYCRLHPERVRETQKRHREKNKCRINKRIVERAKVRLSNPVRHINNLAILAKCRARKRGIDFDAKCLSNFLQSPPPVCACCWCDLDYTKGRGKNNRLSPSVDRVDNERGYVVGNVQIVCRDCNTMKRDLTVETATMILTYINKYVTGG